MKGFCSQIRLRSHPSRSISPVCKFGSLFGHSSTMAVLATIDHALCALFVMFWLLCDLLLTTYVKLGVREAVPLSRRHKVPSSSFAARSAWVFLARGVSLVVAKDKSRGSLASADCGNKKGTLPHTHKTGCPRLVDVGGRLLRALRVQARTPLRRPLSGHCVIGARLACFIGCWQWRMTLITTHTHHPYLHLHMAPSHHPYHAAHPTSCTLFTLDAEEEEEQEGAREKAALYLRTKYWRLATKEHNRERFGCGPPLPYLYEVVVAALPGHSVLRNQNMLPYMPYERYTPDLLHLQMALGADLLHLQMRAWPRLSPCAWCAPPAADLD
jgi:hypothetical protein